MLCLFSNPAKFLHYAAMSYSAIRIFTPNHSLATDDFSDRTGRCVPMAVNLYIRFAIHLNFVYVSGVAAGTLLQVTAPDGQVLQVAVPAGVAPGQVFQVQAVGPPILNNITIHRVRLPPCSFPCLALPEHY